MRRKRSRFPLALIPALVLLSVMIAFSTDGSLGHLIRASLPQSGGVSDDQSSAYEVQAFQAIHAGDNRNAQRFLLLAVQERARAASPGKAYASVADDLLRQGYATQAVSLLENATSDTAVSWSPLVWASLKEGYQSAGDPTRAKAADMRAEGAATAIARAPATPESASKDVKIASADRYVELGDYEIDRGKDQRAALMSYRKALALTPDSPRIMNALGSLLAGSGTTEAEFDEALRLTRLAADRVPDHGVFLDSYGWALFKKRNTAAALQVLTEAVTDEPVVPEIHYHLGAVFAETGQIDDAIREFSRALALRPDYSEAARAKTEAEAANRLPNTSAAATGPPPLDVNF